MFTNLLKANQFELNRQYSDAYAIYFNSSVYVIGIQSAADLFVVRNSSSVWLDSRSLGDSNAWNTSAIAGSTKLLVAGPFESIWQYPSFYGTDIGAWTYSPTTATTYTPFPKISGYDWEVSTDAIGDSALIVWRRGYDISFITFDIASGAYSPLRTVRTDSDNGNLTIQNPEAVLINSSKGAVAYEEQDGTGHNYNLTIFSTSGIVLTTKVIFSDTTGSGWAGQVDVASDGNFVAVAYSPNQLSLLGDASGSGVLVVIFDTNGNELSRFRGNSQATIGDQRFPQIAITDKGNVLIAYSDSSTSNSYVELYSKTGQFLYGDTLTTSTTSGGHFTDGPNGNTLFTYSDWLSGGVAVVNVQDIGSGLVSQHLPGVAPPDTIAPTVSTFSPADAATGVALASDIVLNFSEAIQKGTGNIQIRSGSVSGTTIETFDTVSSNRLTVSGSTLTINPTNNLNNSTQYFVTFAAGSIRDLAGNNYAGTTTYDFNTSATPVLNPTYTLTSSNFSFNEGSAAIFSLKTTNVISGTSVGYSISGITAEDIEGGVTSGNVVVGSNGEATISVALKADMITEGNEALIVKVNNTSVSTTVRDTSMTAATYQLSSTASSVNEGNSASFRLTTTGVAAGTILNYNLSGVSSADIVGGALTGSVKVEPILAFYAGSENDGSATIQVPINADRLTEGVETLSVAIAGTTASASIVINDTSITTATYQLSSTASSVDEGGQASFRLVTTGVTSGTVLNYTLSGVSSADIVGGALAGSVSVGSDGTATIQVPINADRLTEGVETLSVAIAGTTASASIVINDTSITTATYQLSSTASSVNEGNSASFRLTTTGVAAGTILNYNLSGVSSADIVGGALAGSVSVGSDGTATIQVPINADRLTEGVETLSVAIAGTTASASIVINDTSPLPIPSYQLSSNAPFIDEGDIAYFALQTTNVFAGTLLYYNLSGVTPEDIATRSMSGTVAINSVGRASIAVPIAADRLSENIETLNISLVDEFGFQRASSSVTINDTSKQTIAATYVIAPSASSVNEGSTAKFTVTANGATTGTSVAYTLSGLNAEDIVSGEVNGRISLDDLGMATISVPIAADAKTEGSESLTVTIGNATSTITVNDTSKSSSQYYITASDGIVSEGRVATFTVSAADAVAGTKLTYTLSGSGISAKDITNGKLSGSVSVGSDSSAIITVPIAADKTTESDEELTLTITGKGISETITIEDTSTDLPTVPTYTLTAAESSVTEGADAEFLLETTGVETGTQLKYSITGVSTSDVVGKKLSGTVEVSEDGTASIVISTASDALAEGNETLTLTINGQKASVSVLDDTSIKVAQTILEGGDVSLYKASSGSYVVAPVGLADGDALEEYVPLKASAMKDFVPPKVLTAILTYDDGSYGLISSTGTGVKISYSEQKFSPDGIAKGKLTKLTTTQVLTKETISQTDINDDGVIGEVITTVYDDNGDVNQQDYGLYKTSSGMIVLAASELSKDDSAGTGVTLMASKTKGWTIPTGSSIEGIAFTNGGSVEVLSLKGKQYSAQTFDAETGLMKGKAVTLKTAQVDAREYYYDIDLTGDGEISLVGQETMPVGWLV